MKAMKSRRPGDRGGIGKRGPIRTDRDGDMDMDASGARGRRGRGGPGRSAAPRPAAGGRPQNRPKNVDLFEKAIARGNSDAQANIRSGRNTRATDRNPSSLESFSVFGLNDAKLPASTRDGGLSALITFLERRMNVHKKSGARARVTKVCHVFGIAITIHQLRHHPVRRYVFYLPSLERQRLITHRDFQRRIP